MVLQREGKKSELEFCVECSSRTENGMWFSSPNTYYYYYLNTQRHAYSENVCICRQTFCVCIGQKRNLTPCQSYTRMVNAHWTWYFLTRPGILEFNISLFLVSLPFLTSIYNHVIPDLQRQGPS